jgi:sortase (surface protein transpeptidase)
MKKQKNSKNNPKRRLAFSWSSLFRFIPKKSPKPVNKRWRKKEIHLRISRKKVVSFTARRFKTKKANRSKAYKQLVLPFRLYSCKELVVQKKLIPYQKKTPKSYTITLNLQPRKIFANLLIIIGVLGVIGFGYTALNPQKQEIEPPQTAFTIPTPAPESDYTKPIVMKRSEPMSIRIPRIGVDAKTSVVGREDDGTMQTPNVMEYITGWYKYSPTPGELGPAVIVGHVDSYKGPSVFWRLRELVPGDKLEVTREDGSVAKFKVNSLQQFDQQNFPTQSVYGDIEYAGLRLITCGGTFDKQAGRYTENTVVFASLDNG